MAGKQLVAGLLALALAGCGGSSQPRSHRVSGPGYRFLAPAGWKVTHPARTTAVRSGSQLLSVTIFPLVHAYEPVLFAKAAQELDRVASQLAAQEHGRLTERRTATIAGRRVRRYEILSGGVVERLAFVLDGKKEYQLLCRFKRGESEAPCEQLLATFALA